MVVPYTLRQLEYFTAAYQHGSFRAAAAECRVTETALAQAITELEQSLGQTLFLRRRARGVTPTSEARELFGRSRSLLDQANELTEAASELRTEVTGTLRVGCYSTLSPFVVPSIITEFALPRPRLRLEIVEGDPFDLQMQLSDGRLDCVLIQRRQALPGVETYPLRLGEPRVILAADHPLAEEERVPLALLADEPMVILDLPAVRDSLLPMLQEVGIVPNIAYRTIVFETVRSLVARGVGWSILIHRPPNLLSYEGLPVISRRIREPIASSDVSLGFPRGRRMGAKVAAFEHHCREHFRKVDEETL